MTGPKRFKLCKSCGESKPIDDYYRRKSGSLSWLCKTCTTIENNRLKSEKRRLAREARAALPLRESKLCKKCREDKPLEDFHRRHSKTEQRVTVCKECAREKAAEYYADPQVRARRQVSAAAYHHANREKSRTKNLARYGIAPSDYDRMYDSQSGKCAICSSQGHRLGTGGEATRYNVLCVDHNHTSGAVRGLLCMRCNRAIGMLGDDHAVLSAAIDYLQRTEMRDG